MKSKIRPGRPRLVQNFQSKFIAFRIPAPYLKDFDKKAKRNKQTRSARLQYLVEQDIITKY